MTLPSPPYLLWLQMNSCILECALNAPFRIKKINLLDQTKQACWLVFVALGIRGQYKNLVTQAISALDF